MKDENWERWKSDIENEESVSLRKTDYARSAKVQKEYDDIGRIRTCANEDQSLNLAP